MCFLGLPLLADISVITVMVRVTEVIINMMHFLGFWFHTKDRPQFFLKSYANEEDRPRFFVKFS